MRKSRQSRSDSTARQIKAANEVDLSTGTAPRDVPGAEALSAYGMSAYDALFRSREGWFELASGQRLK